MLHINTKANNIIMSMKTITTCSTCITLVLMPLILKQILCSLHSPWNIKTGLFIWTAVTGTKFVSVLIWTAETWRIVRGIPGYLACCSFRMQNHDFPSQQHLYDISILFNQQHLHLLHLKIKDNRWGDQMNWITLDWT
jgi:hypothetical protein